MKCGFIDEIKSIFKKWEVGRCVVLELELVLDRRR